MKFIKFSIIIGFIIFATMPVFAGSVGSGIINSVVSNCSSVTVSYSVTSTSGYPIYFTVTGSAGNHNVSGNVHDGTINIPITPQEDGTEITVTFRDDFSVHDTATVNCSEELPSIEITTGSNNYIDDGRIEPFSSDMVIYPLNYGILVYSDTGDLMLFIPIENIDMLGVPDEGARLLGETLDGYVQIYRLSDGQFQVLVGPDGEGKVHVATWDGLGYVPRDTINTSTFIVE